MRLERCNQGWTDRILLLFYNLRRAGRERPLPAEGSPEFENRYGSENTWPVDYREIVIVSSVRIVYKEKSVLGEKI